jgi:hypothetical protein
MLIIGFSSINDLEFTMHVMVRVAGEKSFENLTIQHREVMGA